MATDFRRAAPPARPTPKRKQSRSCVWWFLMGAGLGVFAGRFHSESPDPATQAESQPGAARDERPAPMKPSFKFEEILDEPAVEYSSKARQLPPSAPRPQPPVVEAAPLAPATPDEPLPQPVTPPAVRETPPRAGTYVVQVGSFKRAADAERVKAELALRGIVASVQTATLPDGQTTHRVRLGPYANKQAAEQARGALRRQGKDGVTYPIR